MLAPKQIQLMVNILYQFIKSKANESAAIEIHQMPDDPGREAKYNPQN